MRGVVALWLGLALLASATVSLFSYRAGGGGLLIALGLAALFIWLLPRLIPREDRTLATSLVVVALIAKFTAVAFRLWVAESVYGYGDSDAYDRSAVNIASLIRDGLWGRAVEGVSLGTESVMFLTGVLYAAVGSSKWGGFLLFGAFSFTGAMLFYRAFRIGFPNGNRRLFLILVLFYPALMYWPSAIGKDSLVLLFSGLAACGAAMFCVQARLSGLFWSGAGILGAFLVRPPTAMVLALGLLVAVIVMRPSGSGARWGMKLFALGAVALVGFIGLEAGARVVGIESISPSEVVARFEIESRRDYDAGGDGSNFNVPSVYDPLWAPSSVITVLFRPFPWEAHNVQALAQSFDGLLMLGLVGLGLKRLLKRGRQKLTHKSFLSYVMTVAIVTILILGTLGNFGLLARQRATLLPYVFMAIAAVPRRVSQQAVDDGGEADLRGSVRPVSRHRIGERSPSPV